jgi:hypothetical protein
VRISIPHFYSPIKIASKKQFLLSLTMFFLVGVLVCRGLLECVLPKSIAMIAQLAIVSAILAILIFTQIRYFASDMKIFSAIAVTFLGIMAISCLLTSFLQDFHYWIVYLFFNVYLVVIGVGVVRLQAAGFKPVHFHKIFLFWGWALFIVATMEQLSFIKMPGYSFLGPLIRSASLTGSFLHYPILMALFSYFVLQWYLLSQSFFYLFSGIVFFIAPILVASRSGAFIVMFTIFIAWIVSLIQGERKALWMTAIIGAILAGLCFWQNGASGDSLVDQLANRVLMAGNLESAGNSGRVHSWLKAIQMWLSTNLLFGEFTGAITNSTKNLHAGQSDVAESGVLQQLVNFGLLGLLFFYLFLFYLFRWIHQKHRLLRYVFLAALTQTLFYQSIEVVPFITLLLFLPWISESYKGLKLASKASLHKKYISVLDFRGVSFQTYSRG